MTLEAIAPGQQYDVFGLYFIPDSELYRNHTSVLIEVMAYTLALVPIDFFYVISDKLPDNLVFREIPGKMVCIEPVELGDDGIIEAAWQGDSNARSLIDNMRHSITL